MSLFFVHIPKTAGTSFRLGAERYFGKENIAYDYGDKSVETSPFVSRFLYSGSSDFWKIKETCEQRSLEMLAGHVNIGRFVSLFGVTQTVSFMREPLQRMASEYQHFVRNYNYKGTFHEFYSRPHMHNRQDKMLHGVNLEAIGFLGLTEHYCASLEMLNDCYKIEIPQREDNRGKQSLDAEHEVSAEDEAEFRRLNQSDLKLYQEAAALFEQRYHLYQEGKLWAHARLCEIKPNRIAGWAWWSVDTGEPVSIEIWINGKHFKTVAATELRPGMCRLLPPRGGYMGFSLAVKLKPEDSVQCRIANTGQWFPLIPCQVTELDNK